MKRSSDYLKIRKRRKSSDLLMKNSFERKIRLFTLLPPEIGLYLIQFLDYRDLINLVLAEPALKYLLHDVPYWNTLSKKLLSLDLREDPVFDACPNISLQFMNKLSKKTIIRGSELFVDPGFCLKSALKKKDFPLVNYFIPFLNSTHLSGIAFELAREGEINLLAKIMEKGGSMNSALEGALEGNQLQLVESLIAQGAKLISSKKNELSPARLAAMKFQETSNLSLLYYLVEAGWLKSSEENQEDKLTSWVNSRANSGRDNLTWLNPQANLGRDFTLAGRDLNQAANLAAQDGQSYIVKKIVSYGGSKDHALDGAARSGRYDLVIELLYDRAQPTCFTLLNAIEGGNKEIVEILIPRVKSGFSTALLRATMLGKKEIVELLLEKKDYNSEDLNRARDLVQYSSFQDSSFQEEKEKEREKEIKEMLEIALSKENTFAFDGKIEVDI